MIASIRGILIDKNPSEVIIDANGLGYQCHISNNTFENLGQLGKEVMLLTYFHITENSQSLFGFLDSEEKKLFEMLISVSGIGPKTAIILLSAVSPEDFKKRLVSGEVSMLTALPGIGPKTARRIIVELKDKFVKLEEYDLPKESSMDGVEKDALDALLSLGFQSLEIKKSIGKVYSAQKNITTQELIKSVLLDLNNG